MAVLAAFAVAGHRLGDWSDWIGLLTFAGLIFYATETLLLRLSTDRSTSIAVEQADIARAALQRQNLPIVLVEWKEPLSVAATIEGRTSWECDPVRIRNVGTGVALNIRIDTNHAGVAEVIAHGVPLRALPAVIAVIPPGGEQVIDLEWNLANRRAMLQVSLRYEDALGLRYESTFNTDPSYVGGFQLSGLPAGRLGTQRVPPTV